MASDQPSTKEVNLALAMAGIVCVYNKFPLGALNKEDSIKSMGLVTYLSQLSLFNQLRDSYGKEGKQEVIRTILFSGKLQSAFCGEMTTFAINYINQMAKKDIAERVSLDYHQMVVIGREKGSNPNDISTWGDSSVICDPWAGIFYETSKFYTIQDIGEKIPVVKTINPSTGDILASEDDYLSGSPQIGLR